MDTKAEAQPTFFDMVKIFAAVAVLLGSVVAYYYFSAQPLVLRVGGVLLALALAAWIAVQSFQGQVLWKFVQASRMELRKVVWPTREETIQTTGIVLLFAAIMGTFFWLLDLGLLALTRVITGRG